MTEKRQGPTLDERDFDAIEAAVMETERGRWFLAEFAKRNRLGETRLLLDAITRLEQNVAGPPTDDEAGLVRGELARIAETLAQAAAELGGGHDPAAALEGFALAVGTLQAATTDIQDAAERVGEIAWQLREAGASGRLCTELETAAADISTASAFGGLTARRASLLSDALRTVTERLQALPPAWRPLPTSADARSPARDNEEPPFPAGDPAPEATRDEAPRAQPVLPPVAALAPVPEPEPASPSAEVLAPEAHRPPKPARSTLSMPVPSLAAIDKLDFRERLKLFT